MGIIRLAALILLGSAFALPVAAQTLYKLIDKNGKVTYAEKPPKDFDGKVIRMDIDPNRNTAVLPKPAATSGEDAKAAQKEADSGKRSSPAKAADERIERARERVERAKAHLQALIDNPTEFDVIRMGKVGGGSRPVLSEEYQARIAQAEADVKAAEEELARLERDR